MSKYTESELLEQFDDMLDDTIDLIDIMGMKYTPSNVLKECDPIAYRVTFNDWLDGLDNCEDCDLNPIECDCDN